MAKMKIENIDAFEFMRSMPTDKLFDAVISDPPYEDILNGPALLSWLKQRCRGNIILFCAPENRFFVPSEYAYWIKPTSTKNYSKHLGRFVEWILIERQGSVFNADLHWSNYIGVYTDTLLERQVHPYQKPISLLERLISIYTRPGDTVFDPFAGSGSVGVACKNLGRGYMGCEIDSGYYQVAKDRLGIK